MTTITQPGPTARLQAIQAVLRRHHSTDVSAIAAIDPVAKIVAAPKPIIAKPVAAAISPAAAPASAPKATAPLQPAPPAAVVAHAIRTDPKLKGMEDIGLAMLDDPDLKGVDGAGLVKLLHAVDPHVYRAAMDKAAVAAAKGNSDAVWERAYAAIGHSLGVTPSAAKILGNQARFGAPTAGVRAVRDRHASEFLTEQASRVLANQRAFGGGKRSKAEVDAVWARAFAMNDQNRRAPTDGATAAQKILANQQAFGCGKRPQQDSSADAVWDRAYASLRRDDGK